MKVKPLWCQPSQLHVEDRLDIYMRCEACVPTRCINTRFMKAAARVLGRSVRKVNTLKGYANWSECVHGEWHMFRMKLTPKYAAKIDRYDAEGHQKFQLPLTATAAFGVVEWKGECVERSDAPETVKERKAVMAVRIADGSLVPRSKFREPQLAYVLAA